MVLTPLDVWSDFTYDSYSFKLIKTYLTLLGNNELQYMFQSVVLEIAKLKDPLGFCIYSSF